MFFPAFIFVAALAGAAAHEWFGLEVGGFYLLTLPVIHGAYCLWLFSYAAGARLRLLPVLVGFTAISTWLAVALAGMPVPPTMGR